MSRLYSNMKKMTYRINKFLGVNESADGDSNLKNGEATVMRNYKVTDNGALKVRGGFQHAFGATQGLMSGAVRKMQSGMLNGAETMIVIVGSEVHKIVQNSFGALIAFEIGTVSTAVGDASIIFFGGKVYIIDGSEYYSYDGTTFAPVDGYVPTIMIATAPDGSGTTYEQINKLTTNRKVRYNADGTATEYIIPEAGIAEIYSVSVDGEEQAADTDYTVTQSQSWADKAKITFNTAPAAGIDNIEVFYSIGEQKSVMKVGVHRGNGVYDLGGGVSVVTVNSISAMTNPISKHSRELIADVDYTVNDGVITIADPTAWTTIRINYTIGDHRREVASMTLSEIYNGAQDSRLFLYGDGSYTALYSGLDENGKPTAEYFPDLNEMSIGDKNTPITAMIRHRNRLLVFKPHSAYSVYYSAISLADNTVTAGFYVEPINREVGCAVLGGAVLVENAVRTIDYNNIYEWKATNTSGNITADARNAEVVSKRVKDTVSGMNLENSALFFDNFTHEFYCVDTDSGIAVVNNTHADAWYVYTNMFATKLHRAFDKLWYGDVAGRVFEVTSSSYVDRYFGVDEDLIESKISCEWESGNIDYGKPNVVKYSPTVWVSAICAEDATVTASISTENGETASAVLEFAEADGLPRTRRARLKARRFTYHRLKLSTDEETAHAIIVSATIDVAYDIPVKR